MVTTAPSADVAIIGLGAMGGNLARNFARRGYRVAVWDIAPGKARDLLLAHGHEGRMVAPASPSELVGTLQRPRRLILLVPAGDPTDAALTALVGHLEPGDVVVDAGNAHFADTRRREKALSEQGVHFLGAGVSGGEEGALHGPSIMAGGPPEAYRHIGTLLEAAAATVDGRPCCMHVGPDGAGHFVKTVHNGIEYADMQLIAEAYDLLSRSAGLTSAEIAEVFRDWNAGDLGSYLVEISADIAGHVDAATGRPLLDAIADEAEQLGTGRWTVQTALDLGVPVGGIAEAVFARTLSERAGQRSAVRESLGPARPEPIAGEREAFVDDLRQALYAARTVACAQGFDTIRTASETYGWRIDLAALAGIWRDGCIIRSRLLEHVRRAFSTAPDLPSLVVDNHFATVLRSATPAWRSVVMAGTQAQVPVPVLSATLSHFDSLRTERLPTTLVQAQRDYMGAHGYRRTDRAGSFHTRWQQGRTEIRVGD